MIKKTFYYFANISVTEAFIFLAFCAWIFLVFHYNLMSVSLQFHRGGICDMILTFLSLIFNVYSHHLSQQDLIGVIINHSL